MMESRIYLTEIRKEMNKIGYKIEEEKSFLKVSCEEHGSIALINICDGSVVVHEGFEEIEDELYEISQKVLDKVSVLESGWHEECLPKSWRCLGKFNNIVMGTRYGMEFATWLIDPDKKGVSFGKYSDSYDDVKEDFMKRSHMKPLNEVSFNKEEVEVIYERFISTRNLTHADDYQEVSSILEKIDCNLTESLEDSEDELEF